MSANRIEAIAYLKTCIARYSQQADELQRRAAEGAGNLIERTQAKMQQQEIMALMEDATRLLSQLSVG